MGLDTYLVGKLKFKLFIFKCRCQNGMFSTDFPMTLRVHGNRWIGRSGCWIKFKLSIGSVSAQDGLVQQSTRKSPLISPRIVGPLDRRKASRFVNESHRRISYVCHLCWPPVCCGCCFFGGKHVEDVHTRCIPDAVINGMKYPYK